MSKMFNYEADHIHDMIHPDLLTDTTHYVSECKDIILKEVTPNYPKLTEYEKEWMYFSNHVYQAGKPVKLEYQTVDIDGYATVENAIPFYYKSAILKGSTKYRDIDTGDILDTFDATKNLELVSVKMPVLTTSNEDGTKTNILTVNEEFELRGVGEVKDELNLLTGELTQRIGEIVLDGSDDENWVNRNNGDGTNTITFQIPFDVNKHNEIIVDKFALSQSSSDGIEGIGYASDVKMLFIEIKRDRLNNVNVDKFKQWLSQNPLMVQYRLTTESIKTVDLNTIIKPYEGTNNYTVSSETIPPQVQLSVPVESKGTHTLNDINQEE